MYRGQGVVHIIELVSLGSEATQLEDSSIELMSYLLSIDFNLFLYDYYTDGRSPVISHCLHTVRGISSQVLGGASTVEITRA